MNHKRELRRALIYDFIERYVMSHDGGPTYDCIAEALDISTTTVRRDLIVLKEYGCVYWHRGKPWSLRVTGRFRLR